MTTYSTTLRESHPIPQRGNPTYYCSQACTHVDWCNVCCADSSSSTPTCILSNIIIMPTYNEINKSDALTCYTNSPKDLATNAVITAGQQLSSQPLRRKENLVDGIYSFHPNDWFVTQSKASERWFVLDFGQTVSFQHVVLYAQNNDHSGRRFHTVEVRVGNMEVTTPPSGFAAYILFSVFQGGATTGQVVNLRSPKPVWARFVSVQMLQDTGHEFQVAHVEVY
ncbi:hypothetical protein Pcinc_013458 [Petrolisthes cinctipes]|uniref:F5/8 type C domain-containing protein n=1 Tax=Petrolisthes cinctipes TaxID=88211 RepID=A0AAE1G2L1_PETCI|nr:hypothetical protein Pcinc_013458 [Petrolisthes cinctipes]